MSLNKRRKKGNGRKKLKRKGGLETFPVDIKVWGETEVERVEALISHRSDNLKRAIQKGYHPAAIGRYRKEIEIARERLAQLIADALQEEEYQSNLVAIQANHAMRKSLLKLKAIYDQKRGVVSDSV